MGGGTDGWTQLNGPRSCREEYAMLLVSQTIWLFLDTAE